MSGETQSPGGLFVPAPRPVPAPSRRSASGLVLPGVPPAAWMPGLRASPHRDAAFRNYLAHEIGGQELGRPADVEDALAESFEVIQRLLGAPGAWTRPRRT